MATDDRTTNLNLPLPSSDNMLSEDVPRLRTAFTMLDGAMAAKADLDGDGKIPVEQMPSVINNTDDLEEGATNLFFTEDRARTAAGLATASVAGMMRVGSGLVVNGSGVVSVVGGGEGEGLPAFNELTIVPTTVGQTVFTPLGGYTPGTIELFLNGVMLIGNGDDYTAANGTTITLTAGRNPADTLLLRRWTTATNLPFGALVDTPDTLAGYGITDAATGDEVDTLSVAVGGKQAALVSGTNIKTVNGASLLGSGNIQVGAPYVALSPTNNGQDLPMGGSECSLYVTGAFMMYLPAAPALGAGCVLLNPNWSWGGSQFTLARRNSGHYVNGVQQDMVFNVNRPMLFIKYGADNGWNIHG